MKKSILVTQVEGQQRLLLSPPEPGKPYIPENENKFFEGPKMRGRLEKGNGTLEQKMAIVGIC